VEQQPSLFESLTAGRPVPKTDQDWLHLEIQVDSTFSPHAPIDDQSLFAGRYEIVSRLIDTVFQAGRHAIVYGERGVGKTSLANILRDKIFHKSNMVKVIKRSCTKTHDFRLMWVHALDDYSIDGKSSEQFLGKNPNPYDIYKIIDLLPRTDKPVFIFDEFDRISDKKTHPLMADTIKYLADYGSRATVVIVGVADSVAELFGGHPSIQRNVQQIRMPRMNRQELKLILLKRLPLLGLESTDLIQDWIIELSQGLPMYTHLMGQNAARAAVIRRSLAIENGDFYSSIQRCVEEADETVKEGYLTAVRSSRPTNKYKEALLACAFAQTNEKGYFNAADAAVAYSEIRKRPATIPDIARHISAFCDDDRGPALVRSGTPKSYEYRFTDPLVRPYALINGINEGLISANNQPSSASPIVAAPANSA
jgi:Cdc6-like AAA superfamily ATPase